MENTKSEFMIFSLITLFFLPVTTATLVYAEQIVKPTDKEIIDVGFSTDPENPNSGDQALLNIVFINKQSSIQHHIDYRVFVTQGGNLFGIYKSHTNEGSVSIPFQFKNNGTYQVKVEIDGILFQPVPPETALFTVSIGPTVPEFPTSVVIVFLAAVTSVVLISRTKLRI